MEPQYYVIAGDSRYGPANVQTLNQWIAEGRITAGMQVQKEGDPAPIPVTQVPGIQFPGPTAQPQAPQAPMGGPTMSPPSGSEVGGQQGGYAQPQGGYAQAPGGAPYYRTPGQTYVDPELSKKATNAMILGAVSLLCCCIGGIISMINAGQAQTALKNGDPVKAQAAIKSAKGWAIASLVVGLLYSIAQIIFMVVSSSARTHYTY